MIETVVGHFASQKMDEYLMECVIFSIVYFSRSLQTFKTLDTLENQRGICQRVQCHKKWQN